MFDDRVKPGLLSADCLHLSRWWWWRWGWWDIQAMTSILANNVEISKTLCCAEGQTRSLAGICGTTCCSHGLTNRSHRNTNKCQNTNTNTYANTNRSYKNANMYQKHKQVFQKGKGSQLCLKIATVCRLGQSFMVIYIQARRYIYFPCPMLTLLKRLFFFSCISRTLFFSRWTTMTWRPSSARPKSGRSCQPKSIVEQFFKNILSRNILTSVFIRI